MSSELPAEIVEANEKAAVEDVKRAPRFKPEHLKRLRELMGLDQPRDQRGAA